MKKRMKVVHDNFVLWYSNGIFACTDGEKIYIEDEFYNLSHSLRKFIIMHEIAHVELQHGGEDRDIKQEIEADLYAYEHTSVEVAEEFIELLENMKKACDYNEMQARISILKHEITLKRTTETILKSNDEERIDRYVQLLEEVADIFKF